MSILFICFAISLNDNKIKSRKNLGNLRTKSISSVFLRHLETECWSKTLTVYNFRHYWLFCVGHLLKEKGFNICQEDEKYGSNYFFLSPLQCSFSQCYWPCIKNLNLVKKLLLRFYTTMYFLKKTKENNIGHLDICFPVNFETV